MPDRHSSAGLAGMLQLEGKVRHNKRHPKHVQIYRARAALARLCLFAAVLVGLSAAVQARDILGFLRGPSSLKAVEADIARRFKSISHMSPDALAAARGRRDKILLIDVREPDEYAVGRLQGAIRVAPGLSVSTLLAQLKDQIAGRAIVFYCSVGERSSRLAARARRQLLAAKAASVHNLKGGIFAWHNQKRPLFNDRGRTSYVHPFNTRWGKLLQRQALVRTIPAD